MLRKRNTKIIATLGPSSSSPSKFILYFKPEQISLDLILVMDHMKITEKQFSILDSMKNVWEDQLLS